MILNLLSATIGPPVLAFAFRYLASLIRLRYHLYIGWIGSATSGGAGFLTHGPRIWAIPCAVNVAIAVYLWWRSGRRKKRAPRAYGAKSRALIAAMVARLRESLKPRPVLRPQPGGSGA